VKACVKPDWKGGDCYIIGGGASLRDFDFRWLSGRNTIGANDAFRLGHLVCQKALFCDWKWWKINKWDFEKYALSGGGAYSLNPDTARFDIPWLHQFVRLDEGISDKPDTLGMNFSTGAAAVNLGSLLGAKRIFLLGFDMCKSPRWSVTHWHNHRAGDTPPDSYERFVKGFGTVAKGMDARKVTVLNVTDGTSKLPWFRKISPEEMKRMSK